MLGSVSTLVVISICCWKRNCREQKEEDQDYDIKDENELYGTEDYYNDYDDDTDVNDENQYYETTNL